MLDVVRTDSVNLKKTPQAAGHGERVTSNDAVLTQVIVNYFYLAWFLGSV